MRCCRSTCTASATPSWSRRRTARACTRAYVVEGGQHVDSFRTFFPQIRPLLPCYTAAFGALVAWVEQGVQPPASGPVEPTDDPVDDCRL